MSILIRAAAAYLVLLAAVVAVNFIVTPLYHPGGDEPFTVWEILNWFMAVGMVIALAASYVEKRRVDGDGSADLKRYLEANAVFYGAVAVFILFFWNWFSSLSPNNEADGTILGRHRHPHAHRDGRNGLPHVQTRQLTKERRARFLAKPVATLGTSSQYSMLRPTTLTEDNTGAAPEMREEGGR